MIESQTQLRSKLQQNPDWATRGSSLSHAVFTLRVSLLIWDQYKTISHLATKYGTHLLHVHVISCSKSYVVYVAKVLRRCTVRTNAGGVQMREETPTRAPGPVNRNEQFTLHYRFTNLVDSWVGDASHHRLTAKVWQAKYLVNRGISEHLKHKRGETRCYWSTR